MMNAGVGWYQEKQAGDIVAQLKKGIALQAIVRSSHSPSPSLFCILLCSPTDSRILFI